MGDVWQASHCGDVDALNPGSFNQAPRLPATTSGRHHRHSVSWLYARRVRAHTHTNTFQAKLNSKCEILRDAFVLSQCVETWHRCRCQTISTTVACTLRVRCGCCVCLCSAWQAFVLACAAPMIHGWLGIRTRRKGAHMHYDRTSAKFTHGIPLLLWKHVKV